MKHISRETILRLLAVAGICCLALAACLAPGVRAEKQRILVLADSLPEGAVPADEKEIGKLMDAVELPDALEARFREGQPVWAELTAPVPGLALTEDGYLLAFTAVGNGNAALAFGFAEMADGLRFTATVSNEPLGLRLGEVAVNRDLLIDGQLWHADETGICTLRETPAQEELDKISAEYETAGLVGGLPAERPEGPLPDGFPGTAKPKQTNYTQPAAPESPSVGAAPEIPSVGAEAFNEGNTGWQDVPLPAPNPYFDPYGINNATMDSNGIYNQTEGFNIYNHTFDNIYNKTDINNGGNQEQILPFPNPEPAPAPADSNP